MKLKFLNNWSHFELINSIVLYFIFLSIYLNNLSYSLIGPTTYYFHSINLIFIDNFSLKLLINFVFDDLSLIFALFSSLIFVFVAVYNYYEDTKLLKFHIVYVLLEWFIILTFLSGNIMSFFFFFEASLIPMFLLIIGSGSRTKKFRAGLYLVFYTILGSFFFLVAALIVYDHFKTFNFTLIYDEMSFFSKSKLVFSLFFVSFAIKLPVVPFHSWLPEAHVEASTCGSVILAAILLKIGVYGFIKMNYIFKNAMIYYFSFLVTLMIISLVYSSLVSVRQVDCKRIIAYSSIAHMSMSMFGLISNNYWGFLGNLIMGLGHGFVSACSFFLIGILYLKIHSKIVFYINGLVNIVPNFSLFFFLFSFANIGVPLSIGFITELLIFVSVFMSNSLIGVLVVASTIPLVFTCVWLINRVVFGTFKLNLNKVLFDLNLRYFFILFFNFLVCYGLGIFPQIILVLLEPISFGTFII